MTEFTGHLLAIRWSRSRQRLNTVTFNGLPSLSSFWGNTRVDNQH